MGGSELADWVGAIGQVAEAVGSTAAVLVAFWIGRRDGRRARAELAERDAAQARLLDVRVVEEGGRQYVRTTNYSEGMFFDVTVDEVRSGPGRARVAAEPGAPEVIRVLRPFGPPVDRPLDGPVDARSATVATTFRDGRGLRWRRTGDEPPARHPDPA